MKKKVAQELRETAKSLPRITERVIRTFTGQELLDQGITVINKGLDTEKQVVATETIKDRNGRLKEVPSLYKGPADVRVDHYQRIKALYKKGGDLLVGKYILEVQLIFQQQLQARQEAEKRQQHHDAVVAAADIPEGTHVVTV